MFNISVSLPKTIAVFFVGMFIDTCSLVQTKKGSERMISRELGGCFYATLSKKSNARKKNCLIRQIINIEHATQTGSCQKLKMVVCNTQGRQNEFRFPQPILI